MKKKILVLAAVLGLFGCTEAFSFGIGLQGGPVVGTGVGGTAGVTFKLDELPMVFAVSVPSFNPLAVGVTADWWAQNPTIQSWTNATWKWFYGAGLAGALYISNDALAFGFGGRLFAGTNVWTLKDQLELYLEAAWQPMFIIGSNGLTPAILNFPINIGFRFWF